ncbi:MAG: DNA-processing protein DprA [Anaerolineae bacterium]
MEQQQVNDQGGSTEHPYWLGFSLIPGIGSRRIETLLHAFGTLSTAWHAPEAQLRAAGLPDQSLHSLVTGRKRLDLHQEWTKVIRTGARLIIRTDDAYPTRLAEIEDAPPLLYVRGEVTAADSRALAIVGTRKPSHYGLEVARKLARELAEQGITIISGLAQGIDAAGHQAALEAGGRTIAVLGSGIDQIYPREHYTLASRLIEQGALISEFPLGSPPDARHFPQRNRIISGLSLGVLVVEAPEKSGALITATYAVEQGRDVFAVPGNILNPASRGGHRLIQDGAKLVTDVRDILEEFDITYAQNEVREVTEQAAPESDVERQIFRLLSHEPLHVDVVIRQCGLPTALVTSTLTILELKGLVNNIGGMQYIKTGE